MNSLTRQYLKGTLPGGFYYFTNGKEKYIVEHHQLKGIKGSPGAEILERVKSYEELKRLEAKVRRTEINNYYIKNTSKRFIDAYVAFGGRRTTCITKFLKKGYSHCFLVLNFDKQWVVIDPVIGFTDIACFNNKRFFSLCKKNNFTLVKAECEYKTERPFHLRPLTCVELIKSFLCINKPFIFTPYQLYKYLKRKEIK